MKTENIVIIKCLLNEAKKIFIKGFINSVDGKSIFLTNSANLINLTRQ